MKKIWIVSWVGENGRPTVTAFDNYIAAQRCYEYFKQIYVTAELDEAPMHSKFIVEEKR